MKVSTFAIPAFLLFNMSCTDIAQAGCAGPMYTPMYNPAKLYTPMQGTAKVSTLMIVQVNNHCPSIDHFKWYLNDTLIDGATEAGYSASRAGNYRLDYKYGGSNFTHTFTLYEYIASTKVADSTKIAEVITNASFAAFPNPVNTQLFITLDMPETTSFIRLYNIAGNEVRTEVVKPTVLLITFDVADLPKGIYLLRYENGAHIIDRKIMIN